MAKRIVSAISRGLNSRIVMPCGGVARPMGVPGRQRSIFIPDVCRDSEVSPKIYTPVLGKLFIIKGSWLCLEDFRDLQVRVALAKYSQGLSRVATKSHKDTLMY